MIGPTGCDQLGAFRRAAVEKHHVGVLGPNLIELGPDKAMVVEIETASDGNFGPGGRSTSLSARFRGEKVWAVDHCGGEIAMIDH